jgi:hypothetical protein
MSRHVSAAVAREIVRAGDVPTYRTLADIPDDPPGELLLGMFEPAGPNLLCAAAGVGKGMTGAWSIREVQALGMLPMVYDAENRPREWARRVSGLGGDRSRVVYLQPADLPRPLLGRPLWDIAPHLGAVAEASGADILLVDSVLPAAGVGEDRLKSAAEVPYLFVDALDALGLPSVSFGHPPKGQPDGEPFGSMAWTAAMRLTWSGTRGESDRHQVRWRPRKRNERGAIPGVLLSFAYAPDGRLTEVLREDDDESTRDWLLRVLIAGGRTVAELAEELAEDADETVTEDGLRRIKERLSRSLRRMARDGEVAREGGRGGAKVRWALRWEAA